MSEICDLCKLNSPSGCARIYGESCLKEAADLISSSATNGDVIKTVISTFTVKGEGTDTVMMRQTYPKPYCSLQFSRKYWDTPFKSNQK